MKPVPGVWLTDHVNGVAKVPAPTILMKAGEYGSVNVVNNLPATSNQASCPFHSNTFHCAGACLHPRAHT